MTISWPGILIALLLAACAWSAKSYIRVRYKATVRFGAFVQAQKRGMSVEMARAYSDGLYPLAREDLAHEQRLWRREEAKRFARLVKELSVRPTTESMYADLMARMNGERTQNDASDELIALLAKRPEIAALLEHHGFTGPAAEAKLRDLFIHLQVNGMVSWVRGRPFFLGGISKPRLLHLLLEAEANGSLTGAQMLNIARMAR